jgi:hypothetical protein
MTKLLHKASLTAFILVATALGASSQTAPTPWSHKSHAAQSAGATWRHDRDQSDRTGMQQGLVTGYEVDEGTVRRLLWEAESCEVEASIGPAASGSFPPANAAGSRSRTYAAVSHAAFLGTCCSRATHFGRPRATRPLM